MCRSSCVVSCDFILRHFSDNMDTDVETRLCLQIVSNVCITFLKGSYRTLSGTERTVQDVRLTVSNQAMLRRGGSKLV